MIPVILFDDGAADLGPLSDLRMAYEQRTGALTPLERWARHGAVRGMLVPVARAPALAARLAARGGAAGGAGGALAGLPVNPRIAAAIFVNGRSDATPADIAGLAEGDSLVAADGTIIAAHAAGAACEAFVQCCLAAGGGASSTDAVPGARARLAEVRVWSRPWHLLDPVALAARMESDIARIVEAWAAAAHGAVPSWAITAGRGHAHVHATARIGACVVLDTTHGPILVDEGAEIRHAAVLVGPVYVGPGAIVAERAHIKARTVLGPQCRAGGEIGSTIMQGYSNKVHDGHLGDALLGEWVNLGAGTVNSNLLNTYGEVAMRLRPSGALERTGRQFMGCVVGDHAKLAIGTRIMTGASIGTGAMWAATAPVTGAIGAFRWVTDDGQRMYQPEKFIHLARTVMERRHVSLAPAEEAALRALLAHAAPPAAGPGA